MLLCIFRKLSLNPMTSEEKFFFVKGPVSQSHLYIGFSAVPSIVFQILLHGIFQIAVFFQ